MLQVSSEEQSANDSSYPPTSVFLLLMIISYRLFMDCLQTVADCMRYLDCGALDFFPYNFYRSSEGRFLDAEKLFCLSSRARVLPPYVRSLEDSYNS